MDDAEIHATIAALDQALAGIAVKVAGDRKRAGELLRSLSDGDSSAFFGAFLSEAAALLRARRLLGDAARGSPAEVASEPAPIARFCSGR